MIEAPRLSQPVMHERSPRFGNTSLPKMSFCADIWQFLDHEVNAHLPERFRHGARLNLLNSSSSPSRTPDAKLNADIRAYMHAAEDIMRSASSPWLCQPEVPTSAEILLGGDEEVILTANKIDAAWKSKEKYLKAHYSLLREDAVSPLRDAVELFRRTPDMMENDNKVVSIYEKVI